MCAFSKIGYKSTKNISRAQIIIEKSEKKRIFLACVKKML